MFNITNLCLPCEVSSPFEIDMNILLQCEFSVHEYVNKARGSINQTPTKQPEM